MDDAAPPSHPAVRRPQAPPRAAWISEDRLARLQMLVGLCLGLGLVLGSLYVWRRPRAEAPEVPAAVEAVPMVESEPPPAQVSFGEARTVSCQDPGPGSIELADCGSAEPLIAASKKAILENEACLPPGDAAQTLEFVVDVSLGRKRVTVSVPKSARTVESSKSSIACANAVKRSLMAAGILKQPQAHSRMVVAVPATFAPR